MQCELYELAGHKRCYFLAERKKKVGKAVRFNTQLHDCKKFKSPTESAVIFYVDEAVIGLLTFLFYTERLYILLHKTGL